MDKSRNFPRFKRVSWVFDSCVLCVLYLLHTLLSILPFQTSARPFTFVRGLTWSALGFLGLVMIEVTFPLILAAFPFQMLISGATSPGPQPRHEAQRVPGYSCVVAAAGKGTGVA